MSASSGSPANRAKSRFIRRMFDTIAPDYDRLNAWVSFRMDRLWRRKAVRQMPQEGWIADWCAGTGDMAREYLKRRTNRGRVVMCDFSTEMKRLSGERLGNVDRSRCYYVCCDVTQSPFKDGVFSGQMQGFAVRNLENRPAFFQELKRCGQANGRGALVDLSVPANRLWRWMCNFYFGKIAPRIVAIIARRGVFAYRYLSESVEHHASPASIVKEMTDNGLKGAKYAPLAGGIGVIFSWSERRSEETESTDRG
ncbi:MAG: methyltransferase domain-containing protein [candidate division Zixibacteria bacterium]|nr:methyltransferase domain-containing protein [candidate division Zixibacteria bacterium]